MPYLEFLQNICVFDGHEIKKNQNMIVDELINSEILCSDRLNSDELCLSMQRHYYKVSKLDARLASNINLCPAILLHVNIMKLLVNSTIGKNTYTEIKCHSLVSLDDIEKVVKNKYCLVQVKDVYMKFLLHCHIDTENEIKEIFNQMHIWSLFEDLVFDIDSYINNHLQSNENDNLMESYICSNMTEVIVAFFSHNKFNHIPLIQVHASFSSFDY